MAITLAQLRARARVLADMTADPFLTDAEFNDLVNDGIRALWADVVAVNKDFRVTTLAFSITAAATNFTTLPTNFREVRAVVRNPGAQNEVWLTKLGARAGKMQAEPTYRLEGSSLYVEPALNAIAPYSLKYVPAAPVLAFPGFTVRLATAAALGNYVAAGVGVGHTLTSGISIALTVDGVAVIAGDRVLVNQEVGALATNNGIYTVTVAGVNGVTPWQLTRATDYDTNTEIAIGDVIQATAGASLLFRNTSTTINVDVSAMAFAQEATALDVELEQFQDYIVLHAAIEALGKDESDTSTFMALLNGTPDGTVPGARGRVKRWASDQRSADPDVVEDVRGGSRRRRAMAWE